MPANTGATNPNAQPKYAPPPSTPHNGAWTQDPSTHAWTWSQGATPDPALVSQWGVNALTDNRQDPTGVRNYGTWVPQHGGGWSWHWGQKPDPNLAKSYGDGALTNPDRTPNGADTHDQNTPPPPDVKPPDVTDAWHGVPPDVTGKIPGGTSDGGTVNEPPAHPAFMVSPGSIRNAEQVLLNAVDSQIGDFDATKAYVEMSKGQNLYNNGAGYEAIVSPEDHLLQGIGDVIELVGQFVQMLNMSAQSYAKADMDSFLPGA